MDHEFYTRICRVCGAHHSRTECPVCGEEDRRHDDGRRFRRVLLAVIFVCTIMWVFVIAMVVELRAEDYSVTGHNLTTGERVLGFLHADPSGQVAGYVFDQTYRFDVVGNATGRGLFRAEGHAFEYELEVIQ